MALCLFLFSQYRGARTSSAKMLKKGINILRRKVARWRIESEDQTWLSSLHGRSPKVRFVPGLNPTQLMPRSPLKKSASSQITCEDTDVSTAQMIPWWKSWPHGLRFSVVKRKNFFDCKDIRQSLGLDVISSLPY